jgi:putative transposase
MIKGGFSRQLVKAGIPIGKNSRGEYDLWQGRFREHTLREESDFAHHVDCIHYNPVKHGLVKQVRDWPYSTFHRHVETGIYSLGWDGGTLEWYGDYGESTGEPP